VKGGKAVFAGRGGSLNAQPGKTTAEQKKVLPYKKIDVSEGEDGQPGIGRKRKA